MSKNLKLICLMLSVLLVGVLTLAFSPLSIVDPPENKGTSQATSPHTIQSNTDQLSESLKLKSLLSDLNGAVSKIDKDIQSNNSRIENLEDALKRIASKINQEPSSKEEKAREPASPEDQLQQRRERAYEQARIFDEALAAEKRDESWAGQMEHTITMATEAEAYSGSTFGVPKCGSSFCRIEAYHSDSISKDSFESMRRDLPNSYHIQHFEDTPGQLRSVMYVIREGKEESSVIFETLAGR